VNNKNKMILRALPESNETQP